MGLFSKRKKVGVCRKIFRGCRIVLWFALFLVVAELSYLHLVGLPDFLKPPLLQKIRERGFEAQFTSARLGWEPAIIIENAGFDPTNESSGPRLSAGLTEVKLNWNALLHRRILADSVQVLNAQVRIPVPERYGTVLSLDQVHLTMRLFSNDVAQLTDLGALFRGTKIRIDGEITNFASISDWKIPVQWQANTNQSIRALDILNQIRFGRNSKLNIYFSADGRDMNTLRAEALLTAPVLETPWARADGFQLRAAAAHLLDFTNRPSVRARAAANSLTTRWGTGQNVSLTADFLPGSSTPFNASVNFAGDDMQGKWNSKSDANWVRARHLQWDGEVALALTNFRPTALEGTLSVAGAESQWGSAGALSLALKAADAESPLSANTNWGIWTQFSPYAVSCHLVSTNIQIPQLRLDSLALDAAWRAPQLAVEKLEVRLYGGRLDGGADLDIDSRESHIHGATDFDPHRISQLLTPAAERWLSQFSWQTPPTANAQVRLVLPPWTNRAATWRDDLRAGFQMAGDFSVGAASFRNVQVASAGARCFYTNRVWTVTGLHVARTDGSIHVDYTGNDATHEFHALVDSRMDPAVALPLLEPRQQKLLRELHFSTPPEIHAEARGDWDDLASIGVTGMVLASNFTVRGQSIDDLHANAEYTNNLLRVTGFGLSRGEGRVDVPLATLDFKSKRIFLTNGQSTLDPQIVPALMGTNTPPFLNLVHFEARPTVRASGSFVPGDALATDMRFEVQGEHFHWTNLSADKASGMVFYIGRNITLTNIDARVYKSGKLTGWLAFEDRQGQEASFSTDFTANNIDLALLARDLEGKNAGPEGMLDGYMTLKAPAASNKETWAGNGYIHVHDALLWKLKIFGFLSPVLNAMSPGLGDSRARQASARFTVGDGKVSSDDLEIHSTGLRLLYRGSVTMNKKINGRVEADLSRDMPVFGPFLSVALTPFSKLFEYQITGSLEQPVVKPVYLPKFLMFLLRPFESSKARPPETPSSPPPKENP